mgnify:CR=1
MQAAETIVLAPVLTLSMTGRIGISACALSCCCGAVAAWQAVCTTVLDVWAGYAE